MTLDLRREPPTQPFLGLETCSPAVNDEWRWSSGVKSGKFVLPILGDAAALSACNGHSPGLVQGMVDGNPASALINPPCWSYIPAIMKTG